MSVLLGKRVDRPRDRAELIGQGSGQAGARFAGAVELARPRLVGVPLAREVSLLLQATQQGVEGVGVGVEPAGSELLQQSVPVARLREQSQARQYDGAAPELLQMGVECFGLAHASHCTVS